MCDCFHIAFPNWHAASSGAGPGRRLRGPEPGTEDNSICDEASQFTEEERPRPQGSSPVEEFPESDKYGDSDKECEAEHDPYQKRGKKPKKSGLGSIFDKRSTPKMSKLKEAPSPEAGVIVKTAKDGCAEGLVYSGGGKDGIFIKEVVPESPASKNLHLKEGDQVLSATVYFDNIPYEDAIQILEHAQAYKVKLCLKRKPEITETEGVIDSDAIPEDEVHPPEMREHGKKRRGDARISWPKFPTLGRGKKSRFTRSHSTSEADEQRKLELSPTTSDTESPIKSQDALKGKKKHKIKLPGLKRGRISSSEDTDAQNIQTEDMISPECLESPLRETQDVEDEQKKTEKDDTNETETHKVELVCLDSTLKTTDITAALVEQETLSSTASPDGKKKKKERSELKLKILGRDKKHKAKSSPKRLKTLGASLEKTDDKENEKSDVVPSGETEKVTTDSDISKMTPSKSSQMELRLPKVEIDLSDVGIICKSKAKGAEEKQSKTGFKLPKVGLGDVPTEEIIKIDTSVVETKGTEKVDAYDRLSKGTELPKREDIEIPGMEDVSKMTKDSKEPRAPLATISDAELQAETVQMSIDVESVKEAVSKLPGYKLPKVDMSGVPIPEEITVIDANAQRISVKTPTKGKHESKSAFTEISKTTFKLPNDIAGVSKGENISGAKIDVKKLELESKDVTVSTRAIISHTIEVEKVQKGSVILSSESEETQKELDIKMMTPKVTQPDLSISKSIKIPDFKMDLAKSSEKKDDNVKGERTIFLPEDKYDVKLPDAKSSLTEEKVDIPSTGTAAILKVQSKEQQSTSVGEKETPEKQEKGGKFKMPTVGISMPKVKGGKVDLSGGVHVTVPEMEVDKPKLEIDSKETESEKDAKCEIELKSPEISLSKRDTDVLLPDAKVEVSVPKIESTGELEPQSGKFKLPKLGLKMPTIKGSEVDASILKKDIDVTLPDVKAKVDLPGVSSTDVTLEEISEQKVVVKKPETEMKAPAIEGNIEVKDSKFKMPKLGVKLPKVKGSEIDITLSKKDGEETPTKGKEVMDISEVPDISSPEKKILKTESEFDGQGGKFKMPKLGVKLPKVKGSEIDIRLSKKDGEETLTKVKEVVDISEVPDISSPEKKIPKTESEFDGQGGKFKMPKLGITMPKLKGPEIDLNLSKKEVEATLPEVKADIKVVDLKPNEASVELDVPTAEIGDVKLNNDVAMDIGDPTIDAKTGKFKMPKFEISMPQVKGPEVDFNLSKKDKAVKSTDLKAEIKMPDVDITVGQVDVPEPKIEIAKPKVEIKPLEAKLDIKTPEFKSLEADTVVEGQTGKFQIPRFTIAIPKVKGPEVDLSSQKKDMTVTLPKAKIEGELPKFPKADVEVKSPEIDAKLDGQSGKIPKFGIKMPKVKGPEIDISLPKKEVKSPEIKADIKLPEVPKVDVNFGEVDVKIPGAKTEVVKPDVPHLEIKPPSGKIKIKAPDIDVSVTEDSPSKFKIPSLGFSKKDVAMPEVKAMVTLPEVESKRTSGRAEVKEPEGEVSAKGSPLKFKMPTIKLPIFGGAIEEKDSKADVTVTVPQANVDLADVKAEISLPETEVKAALGEVVIEQPSGIELDAKFKKPRFSLPRFSFSKASVPAPEVDISAPEVNVPEIEGKVEMDGEIDAKAPELDTQIDGQGSKFKLPKFGITMPKISAPEIDLSLSKKDVEMNLPEAKVKGKLPDVEVKAPSIEAEIKVPEVKVESKTKEGSPSKIKMPTFKLPKFGVSIPEAELKIDGTDTQPIDNSLPEVKAEVSLPDVNVNAPSVELEIEKPSGLDMDAKFKKPRFSLPRFSFSKASAPAAEVDVSAPEVNMPETEGKVEVKGDIDVKASEFEPQIDGQGSKFKLPKFGIAMPKISAPEIDLSLSKKEEVTLPEAKVEGKLPDVKVKAPSIEADIKATEMKEESKTKEGSPSKLKMPTFKLPKFGTSIPEAEIKIDERDGPQVDVAIPETKAEVKVPDVEAKAPSVELEIEKPSGLEIDAKFKKPRFSLPRFSFSKPSVSAPEVEVSAPEINIAGTEGKVEVKGEIDVKAPEFDAQIDGQGRKFKLPKFGITMPTISSPEIDLSLSKKEVEVTLPEAKVEGKLPEVEVKAPSIEAEIKVPEIKVESKTKDGSPSKLKMPTFKLPKFGASIPENEIKVDGADIVVPQANVELPDVKAEVNLSEVDVKAPSIELETEQPSGLEMDANFKKPRFSLPRFSFSKPSVQAPEVDVIAPEVSIPQKEGKVEIKGEIDMKAPELEPKIDGEGSKFKLPKFGITMPKISAPDIDLGLSKKDVEVTSPKAKVEGKLPEVEVKAPSIEAEINTAEIKVESKTKEGSPSKLKMPMFKLPKFGASIPEAEIKMDETDTPQIDVDLPKVKAEVNIPDVDIKPSVDLEIEKPSGLEMDAKFKKPRFSLPRFSFSKPSVSAPDMDISAPAVNIPETEGKVEIEGEIDVKSPEFEAQIDGQGSKFKLPKFGIAMPKISTPEIDLSLSKKEAEVTLPEAKVEGKLPGIDVKAPSIEAEIKAPKIKAESKSKEKSPSKMKMPAFKLPTFGASIPETEIKVDEADLSAPQVDIDLPDVKAEVLLTDIDVKAPSGEVVVEQPSGLEMDAKFKKPRFSLPRFSFSKPSVSAQEVDVSAPEINIPETDGKVEVKDGVDVKIPELEAQTDGQGSKFKLPKFGIAMPKISTPEIDLSLSKKDVEIGLPEAKVEGDLLDIEVKAPSLEEEMKVESKKKEGSPSKLKMPAFKLPKFGASIPEAEIKVNGADVTLPQVDVDLPDVKAEVNLPEVEVKAPSGEVVVEQPSGLEMDSKFKKPRFSLPRFSFSKPSVPAPEVDVSAPEMNIPETEGKVEVKEEIDVKTPELEAQVDGQGSKFKLPKFGITMPKISAPEIDLSISTKDVDTKVDGAEVTVPQVEIKASSDEAVIEQPSDLDMDSKFKKPRFSLPRFSFSKQSAPAPEIDIDAPDMNVQELEKTIKAKGEVGVNIKANIPDKGVVVQSDSSSVDIKVSEPEGKRSKFKLPSLGFSTPDIDVAQKEVEHSNVEMKKSPAKVDIKGAEIEESSVEGSPSKFKIPTFKLPKFGGTAEIDEKTPTVDINISNKDIKDEKSEVKEELKESTGSWSLRKISFSKPSVAAPDIDVKLPKVDVSVPESKKEMQSPDKKSSTVTVEGQPTSEADVKLKKPRFSLPKISFGKQSSMETEAEVDGSVPDVTAVIKQKDREQKENDVEDAQESKFKIPSFGISMPKVKAPEVDLNLSKKDANINSPEAKIETTKTEESEVAMDAPQKGASWSFPRFSFSKPAVNVTVESDADVKNDFTIESTPKSEGKKHSVNEEDSPAVEPEIKAKFSLPRFSFSKTSTKEPTIPENAVAVEVSLSEGEVKIKESKVTQPDLKGDVKLSGSDTKVETVGANTAESDIKSKDSGGSPSKFKMPIFKMPKIGITATVSEESNSAIKETEEILQITKEGKAVVIPAEISSTDVKIEASIKKPSMEIKSDVPKASTPDTETPQGEALGSPSKFKLPSFKMPRLSFSKPKPEDEYTSTDSKVEEKQLETDSKEESKSPKISSFGDILKNIDVEFDVPNPLDENLGSPKEDQAVQKQQESFMKVEQEAVKSPEKTGWFKFPTFGLSSPTEEAKGHMKEDKLDNKSPVDLTGNEELSPTCSIQSSEAFADISSTMTSENVGFSLSSPTRVTVKYSDPNSAALTGEMPSNVVMSTTKTEVISVEPDLPEKVTILSSGLSSSSEDTLKLASGKIHIITSNVQATPESQQAKMLTSIHVQSAEGASGQESWTVTDSQSSMGTFMESRVVREFSSESKEVVITKQITRVVTSTEPISDETATSIKQLKDSVHTEKMRFFDGAEK